MKKVILLIIGFFLLSGIDLSAQIYGCYYFIKSGTDLSESTEITIVYFSGDVMSFERKTASEVSSRLTNSSSYWENELKKDINRRRSESIQIKYDYSLSNSKYNVYKGDILGSQRYVQTGPFSYEWVQSKTGGHFFFALSKDKDILIYWNEDKGSSVVKNKIYYDRIEENVLKIDSHEFLR